MLAGSDSIIQFDVAQHYIYWYLQKSFLPEIYLTFSFERVNLFLVPPNYVINSDKEKGEKIAARRNHSSHK